MRAHGLLTIRVAGAALAAILIAGGGARAAEEIMVKMHRATPGGPGDAVGTVTIVAAPDGTHFVLDLHGLPPGPHGLHVHQHANCGPTIMNGVRIPAGAAGAHWDPDSTHKHAGPKGAGHLGDLPVLEVNADGTTTQTLKAPHITKIDDLRGKALVIHVGGDNYSDQPAALGGGGVRLACGPIPK